MDSSHCATSELVQSSMSPSTCVLSIGGDVCGKCKKVKGFRRKIFFGERYFSFFSTYMLIMSSSPISFDNNFKANKKKDSKNVDVMKARRSPLQKKEYDIMKANTNVQNDKDELYDYLQKNNNKNLDKLSKLLEEEDRASKLLDTPLHKILSRTINTVEKLSTKVSKQEQISLTHHDKTYLGVGFFLIALILTMFT